MLRYPFLLYRETLPANMFVMDIAEKIIEEMCGERRKDPSLMSPLTLAYIGDTIYDLFIRMMFVEKTDLSPRFLHRNCSEYVCAAGQKKAYHEILPLLTEEEKAVFRRGRNAHSGTIPKNATVSDYHTATGFEALLGYLFLSGREERLCELIRGSIGWKEEKDEQTGR